MLEFFRNLAMIGVALVIIYLMYEDVRSQEEAVELAERRIGRSGEWPAQDETDTELGIGA